MLADDGFQRVAVDFLIVVERQRTVMDNARGYHVLGHHCFEVVEQVVVVGGVGVGVVLDEQGNLVKSLWTLVGDCNGA